MLPRCRLRKAVAPALAGVRLPASTRRVAGVAGRDAVREARADRRRRLGVLLAAQVVEDRAPLGRAEPLLERGEELRAARLVAAAGAEAAADRGRGRDGVLDRPRPNRHALAAVVRVDPGRVGGEVGEDAAAERAARAQEPDLLRQRRVELRARHERPRLVVRGPVDGRERARAADQLEQEPAVLGADPAGRVHHVGLGLAVHVRRRRSGRGRRAGPCAGSARPSSSRPARAARA